MKRKKVNIQHVGDLIKKVRKARGMLLRELAAALQMDMGLLSKIERANRLPTKEQIAVFCAYFENEREDIYIAWLSDKVVMALEEEEYKFEAMIVAEQKLKYKKTPTRNS